MTTLQKAEITFETRTGSVHIDLSPCAECDTYACVKACSLYGSNIFRLTGGLPALKMPVQEAGKQCIECLACELACQMDGLDAITIRLPIAEVEKA